MIRDCVEKEHEVFQRDGYRVCMELKCPDVPVKIPRHITSKQARNFVRWHKKNRRKVMRIEEWESFEGSDMLVERVEHWLADPYRRWWQHLLLTPVYILCILGFFIYAIWVLTTTEYS